METPDKRKSQSRLIRHVILVIVLTVLVYSGGYVLEHPELWQPPVPVQQRIPELAVLLPPVQRPVTSEFHEPQAVTACIATPTREVTTAPSTTVYRWTDENGRMVFGDRPPPGTDVTAYDAGIPLQKQYFQLAIEFVGRNSAPFLRDRLSANVTHIYELISGLVGDERLSQVDLNVRIFEDRNEYRKYAQNTAGQRSADAGGFYTVTNNEAVTFQYPEAAQTLEVTRHEAVHVIVAGLLGSNTPLWLNEGLAEYYELLQMQAQYSQVPVNESWLAEARLAIDNGYPQNLEDYLALGGEAWYENRQSTHYALGWSLVYFLLDSQQGRQALAVLMQAKADNYCAGINHAIWLTQTWQGGIEGLESDYYGWLRNTSVKGPHRY